MPPPPATLPYSIHKVRDKKVQLECRFVVVSPYLYSRHLLKPSYNVIYSLLIQPVWDCDSGGRVEVLGIKKQ